MHFKQSCKTRSNKLYQVPMYEEKKEEKILKKICNNNPY